MPLDPRTFDKTKPLALAAFGTLKGHQLHAGEAVTIVTDPEAPGEVTLDEATHLWSAGRVVYAEQVRPTPVETSRDAAQRETEVDDLGEGEFMIRAPWLEQGERVSADALDQRRAEVIEQGVAYHDKLIGGDIVVLEPSEPEQTLAPDQPQAENEPDREAPEQPSEPAQDAPTATVAPDTRDTPDAA